MFGVNLYVVAAIAVLVLGLTGASYALYERGNAATARAEQVEAQLATAQSALAESEKDAAAARAETKRTDAALVEKDKRLTEMLAKERNVRAEYNRLKGLLDQKDKDCLDRPLPDGLASRLREPPGSDKDAGKARPEGVNDALPQVVSP
jgi:uncharacterized protein HemX